MNSTNAAAVEQMAKYYWGMLGAARTTPTTGAAGAATSSLIRSSRPLPAAHGRSGGEPSWEELAFARDAAGQLGGCVWPPRSYTCTFCRREFRSAQALGGHMNVHRRDRARLRQCASPSSPPQDHDQEPIPAPLPAPELADHHQLLQLQGSPLFTTTKAAVLISGRPACDHHHQQQNYHNNNREEEAVIRRTTTTTTTSPRYISTTIIKESKSKVVISIPASTAGSKEAAIAIIGEEEEEEEEIMVAGTRKRRRVVPQPPETAFTSPLYDLRFPASSPKGVEHDAKVPKVTSTSPSSFSPLHHLAIAGQQEEVDLELRLGTS